MFKKLLKIAAAVVITIVSAGTLAPIIGAALGSAMAGSAIAGAIAGGLSAKVTGGDWKKGMLLGGVIGAGAEALTGVTQGAMEAKAAEEAIKTGTQVAAPSAAEAAQTATPVAAEAPAIAKPPVDAAPPMEVPAGPAGPVQSSITAGGGTQSIVNTGPASGMMAGAPITATQSGPVGMLGRVEAWANAHPWLAKAGGKGAEMLMGGLAKANTPTDAEQMMELEDFRRKNLSGSVSGMQTSLAPNRPGMLQNMQGQPVFKNGMLRS